MCTGNLTGTYRIVPKDLSSASISAYWSVESVNSTNEFTTVDLSTLSAGPYLNQTYSLTIMDRTKKLTKGIEYTVSLDDNTEGAASFKTAFTNATVNGIGNYCGHLNDSNNPFAPESLPLKNSQGTIET